MAKRGKGKQWKNGFNQTSDQTSEKSKPPLGQKMVEHLSGQEGVHIRKKGGVTLVVMPPSKYETSGAGPLPESGSLFRNGGGGDLISRQTEWG